MFKARTMLLRKGHLGERWEREGNRGTGNAVQGLKTLRCTIV